MAFAATFAKAVHVAPASMERSILKLSSLVELSTHARFIWLLELAVAVKLLGAAGFVAALCVVALAVLE